MSKENTIVGVICLVFFVVIGYLFWLGPSSSNVSTQIKDPSLLVRDNSHMTGTSTAKVTVVEFGDFECPACAGANPELKKTIDAYKSNPNFNFVFRHFPLPQHKNAIPAALVAEAAGAQGKFFEMDSALYENQSEWGESADPSAFFTKYATALDLDMTKFNADIKDSKYSDFIQSDAADGATLGIDHTPTVFINGAEQTDLNFASMKTAVDGLLAK